MASILAYARDTFLHVCTVIAHLLHLDQLVAIGHSTKSTTSARSRHDRALEAPPNTVTIEALSPRTFSHETSLPSQQASPRPAASATTTAAQPQQQDEDAEQETHPIESSSHSDVSEITPALVDTEHATSDDTTQRNTSGNVDTTAHELMVLPTAHDLMVLPTKQSVRQEPEVLSSATTESTPAAPTETDKVPAPSTHTPEDNNIPAAATTARESVPEDKPAPLEHAGSEHDLLAAAAAASAASASAGNSSAESPSRATSDKPSPLSDTTDDLDRVSTESNATDDTEEDRVRALDQSFGSDDVPDKRRVKKDKSKGILKDKSKGSQKDNQNDNQKDNQKDIQKDKLKRSSRQSGSRGPRRRSWSASSSSDDEDALKAEMYAASPRCLPPLNRAAFTTM